MAARKRCHRGLHPLDVAAVIGAPDVDQVAEAAIDLGLVIGDIGGEIRIAAVRFHQRPVDIIAEIGRLEQNLLAVLPIVWQLPLRGRQPAFVDEALPAQEIDRISDLIAVLPARQRALGEEDLMRDVERGEIGADHLHHAGDGRSAHVGQPDIFRSSRSAWPCSSASDAPTGFR